MSRPQQRWRLGFSLVELLVVIAIISILLGLLLPAVQYSREAARRISCSNNLRQVALGMLNYEGTNKRFPPGFTSPGMTMWSAFVLPYVEQNNLYNDISLGGPWTGPIANPQNIQALGHLLPVFRCPSSDQAILEFDSNLSVDRVPCSYLAVCSGLRDRESGDFPWAGMNRFENHPQSDGIFYLNSGTRMAEIRDGTSHTALVADTFVDQSVRGLDAAGNDQKLDHWYIGSGELLSYQQHLDAGYFSGEVSECLGSTAIAINAFSREDATTNQKELGFGSRHAQGINVAMADGHLEFVSANISAAAWSARGTIHQGESVSE